MIAVPRLRQYPAQRKGYGVTTSTRPKRYGVEKHGTGYRIKMRWRPYVERFYVESGFADELDADVRARELHRMRDAGSPPPAAGSARTVEQMLDAYLADREGARSTKGERLPLRDSTIERDRHSARALLRYLDRTMPIEKLTRELVVEQHRERAKAHPKAAAEELALLKAALRHAEDRGTRGIDYGIGTIARSPVPRRARRAITAPELVELGEHRSGFVGAGLIPADELPMILGQTGIRIGEALALRDTDVVCTPARVELRIRSNKEGNPDKRVRVVHAGARATLRRALGLRDSTAGPRHLFADERGRALTYSQAYGRAWLPAIRAASAAWLAEHPRHDPADNPFAELTPHDLRSTFATIMRTDYRLDRETVSTLLGHRDGGALLARVYEKADRYELAEAALARFDDDATDDAIADRYQSTGAPSPVALGGYSS